VVERISNQLPPRDPAGGYLTYTPIGHRGEDEEDTGSESPAEADESDAPREKALEGVMAVDDRAIVFFW
jgi:hypothetical protein